MILVFVEREWEICAVKLGQSFVVLCNQKEREESVEIYLESEKPQLSHQVADDTYHTSLLDDTEQLKSIQWRIIPCRELQQLLAMLSAQNSSIKHDTGVC